MKLYLEDDSGNKTELTQLPEATVDSDVIIFTTNTLLNTENIERIVKQLEDVTKKKCIILGNIFDKVYGIKR